MGMFPVKHPGKFTRKAKKAGMSVQAYARKEKNAKGPLGKEARFAANMKKHHGFKSSRKG